MKNTLAIALFIILAVFKPALAAAEQELVKIAACHVQSVEISMLLEPGATLKDGANVVAVSSQISALTGLNLTTSAVYHAADGSFDLPHWNPRRLSSSDCGLVTQVFTAAPPSGPLKDELMYLQEFFINGTYSPDVDIDDLVQKGEAIPLKVHVICRTRQPGSGAMSCEKVRILDEVIPVETMPKPLPPKPKASQTVQLTSGLCGSPAQIESSGAIVMVGAAPVVLTSAAAILSNEGKNSCTTATLTDGTTYSLTLERQDWANGLALLNFPAGTTLVSLRLRQASSSTPFDTVSIGTRKMSVLAETSSRHFFPSVNTVVELQGDVLSSKDIGAPVLDADGQLAAIVSDSYIKIFPGSLSRPQRFYNGDHSDHVLAISATTISSWLVQSSPAPAVWALSSSQLTGPLTVKSGHLVFNEICPPLSATAPDPDYPIGGGDAAGIGGDSTRYRACQIKVTLDESGDARFFVNSLQSWHDRVVQALKSGLAVQIPFEAGRRQNGALDRFYNYSVLSFFQMIRTMSPGFTPIDVRMNSAGKAGGDASLSALRTVASELEATARAVYAGFTTSDPRMGELIRRTYLIAVLAESENWSLLEKTDFSSTLDPAGPDAGLWNAIVQMAYQGPRLKKDVQALQVEFAKVKP